MTLQQFLEQNNGKYVEVAGSADALNQCTDLANKYIRDVLGLPIIEWTNAVDFPSKVGDAYDWIPNTLTNIPQEGDIVVWKPSPGHIAVFIEGNVDTFRSFDENFPIGSPCHIQNHTYVNVTGWLRKKVSSDLSLQAAYDACRVDRDSHWNDRAAIATKLNVENNMTVIIGELDKLLTFKDSVIQKDKQIIDIQKQATELQTQLADKDVKLTEVGAQVATLTVAVAEAQKTIDDLTKQTKDDQTQLADLQHAAKIYSSLTGIRKWIFDTFIR